MRRAGQQRVGRRHPDLNRHMARNTPYAAWHASLAGDGEHAYSASLSPGER